MGALDWLVVALYAAVALALGRATAGRHDAPDLLLGRRQIPTWAVLGSMVATELSAATFLGVPDAAFGGSWSYLQLAFGALLGKIVVSRFVIPLYHQLELVSLYELLALRFGRRTQRTAALCFVGGRVLASGVRLFIAALAFSAATGADLPVAILASGIVAGLYTRTGGIRSVIYTDVLQAGLFGVAAILLLGAAFEATPGGVTALWDWAREGGRTRVFSLSPLFTASTSAGFGTAFVGGFFLTLATHGTDFDMVQRLLTARSGRAGGRALLGSGLLNFPITLLFLAVGTAIAGASELGSGFDPEAGRVVPQFAVEWLAPGLRGLVFAGLFAAAMSSLDSAICAIGTSFTVDVRGLDPGAPEMAGRLRRATVGSTAALIAAALAMAVYYEALVAGRDGGLSLVEVALSAMTILYGGLLAVFAVAIARPGVGDDGSARLALLVGGACGFALFLHPVLLGKTLLAWTWWIPTSAALSLAVVALAARGRREIG